MAEKSNGEARTSPDWAILIQHVETPEFTPLTLWRQGRSFTTGG